MLGSHGRYRIEGSIAVGGMGEVLRARVTTLGGVDKIVALKLVRNDLAGQKGFAGLFVDEVRVAMALSHSNIVQSFDVGQIDDRFFLAMEHVDGLDLADLLRRRGRALGLAQALYVAVEILKGLDYAHRRTGHDGRPLGIVHRDVSPGNVLLSREGEVKLADFGVAKSTLRDVGSIIGSVKGKIPYMPPEQVRGSSVDRRADVYSLAAVLYEMVSGERLFAGDGTAIVPEILGGPGRALGRLQGRVPAELSRILARALAVDPEVRHPTAALLRNELERLSVMQGLLLSSADLVVRIEAALAAPAPPARHDEGGPMPGEIPITKKKTAQGFDDLLGHELERLGGDAPYSMYTTRSGLSR